MRKRVLAVAAAACATMLVLDRRLNLWIDEGYTLETTDHGIRHAANAALDYELYPPLYFAALAAWRTMNRSYPFARALSTIAATLLVADATRVLRAYVPEADETSLALALALHPRIVWAGTEARPYAQAMWLSARILGAFRDAYLVETPRRGARARFVAWAAVAMYTHVYLGFVLVGCGIACLVAAPRRFGALVVDALAVAAAIVPFVVRFRAARANYSANYEFPSTSQLTRAIVGALASFVVPNDGAGRMWRPLVGAGVLACAVVAVTDPASRRAVVVPFAIAAGALATWSTAVVIARTPPLLPAHATPFLVPVLSAALALLRTRGRTRVGALAVALLGLNALRVVVRRDAKTGDWRRVAAFLDRYAGRDESIAVFGAEATMPLRRHLREAHRVDGVPADVAFDRYDLSRYVIRGARQLDDALAHAAGRRLWLVSMGETWEMNAYFRSDLLEDYVAARYTTLRDERFDGSRVRLLAPIP